jgi:hypothetical protein
MMAYEYKNPVELGYRKVKINKKTHNILFPNRKARWIKRFEYYVKDSDFLIHQFDSYTCIFLNIITFPLVGLMHGFFNKEVTGEYKRMIFPKRNGSFVEDKIWSSSKMYQEIISKLS